MSQHPFKLTRIPSLKSVSDFRGHVQSLGLNLPCDEAIVAGSESPLAQPITKAQVNGKTIGNRFAIHPMEGWDGTTDGGVTEEMLRRWSRFGESGAKVIFGGEAMAVRPDGRANPNQIIINDQNKAGIARLRETLFARHKELYGKTEDLVVGFQLTHSGRFCRPRDKKQMEPRVAYRHPILDRKFKVESDAAVLTDTEIEELIQAYIKAAQIAADVGADFVDIKHCHGYLLHEFLGAHTRPGKYGGSFENRTRILREIISGIRASGNKIDIAVRLSAFDFVPFKPDPALSQPGKLGPGIPEDYSHCLPYKYGFGVNPENPVTYDLREPIQFVKLCAELGVKMLNLSAGSPYYNPHIQRPAAYPPSDGYQPAHDPLIDVARQLNVVREIKAQAPPQLIFIGTAYTYLQEYLPHVAQYVVREGWTDMVGLGRMALSYPAILSEAIANGAVAPRAICRTFSDCTTAPRNGLISGCYPLDRYYAEKPEAQKLKDLKKGI
ncbi:MAG TPA: NADH:flavin oxidoreductase [Methylomirabilota bacterium]|nr:NADH:flavin oxidoreductase [Methylomirabilota bacterium]